VSIDMATDQDGIYRPDPPVSLKATQEDLGQLAALVDRLGWQEVLFRVGQLLAQHCHQATGDRKGSLRAVCNHINFIVPGAHWCDSPKEVAAPTKKDAET
jgi:hypothetical protein